MSKTTQAFIGKGSIYIKEVGANKGFLPFGNCPEFTLTFNEDKKEMLDSEDSGGGVVTSVSRVSSVTGSVSSYSISKENLAIAMRGLVSTESTDAVTGEKAVANEYAFIQFAKVPTQDSIVVKDEAETDTFVAGVDYEVQSSGITIIAGGDISDGETISLSYTPKGSIIVESLSETPKEYVLVFNGLNEANSDEPVEVTCHKVKFSPASALSLIGDDFATIPLEFDVLKDETITGEAKSKYARIRLTEK